MDELNDGGAGKGDSFDDEGGLVGWLVGYHLQYSISLSSS